MHPVDCCAACNGPCAGGDAPGAVGLGAAARTRQGLTRVFNQQVELAESCQELGDIVGWESCSWNSRCVLLCVVCYYGKVELEHWNKSRVCIWMLGIHGPYSTDSSVAMQDLSYQNSWSWFLKPRAQAKEKKLLENFHAAGFPLPKGFKGK